MTLGPKESFSKHDVLRLTAIISFLVAILVAVLLLLFRTTDPGAPSGSPIGSYDGAHVRVLTEGEGSIILKQGDTAVISYAGFLQNGKEFDRQDRFSFVMGDGTVLNAWEVGMAGMKINETRRIEIEPEAAYGKSGVRGLVPPNSKVIFEIKLIGIEAGSTN